MARSRVKTSSWVLLGTAIAAAAGAGYVLYTRSQVTKGGGGPCTSNLECPPGQICSNGHCIPCPKQNCDCSSTWDPINCTCGKLIPAGILVPLSQTVYPYYAVQYDCQSEGFNQGAFSAAPGSPCPTTYPAASGSISLVLGGKVVDSAGHPICNQSVNAALNQTSIPWRSGDGRFVGTIQISAPTNLYTQSDGTFSLVVQIGIVLDTQTSLQNCLSCVECCSIFNYLVSPTQGNTPFALAVQYSLAANPAIQAISNIQVNLNTCGYYHYTAF